MGKGVEGGWLSHASVGFAEDVWLLRTRDLRAWNSSYRVWLDSFEALGVPRAFDLVLDHAQSTQYSPKHVFGITRK